MKIIYLMDQMYIHGGGEKILSLKVNALANDFGCEVYLCTTEQKNKPAIYPISKKVNLLDLNINYKRSKSYFHPINLIKITQHFFKLNKVIGKIQPDVLISVSQSPEQFFLPFILTKIPKIKEFHSSGAALIKPKSIFEKLKNKLFMLFKKYHKVVVLNNDEKRYYPFSNLTVIPNFIKQKTTINPNRTLNFFIT